MKFNFFVPCFFIIQSLSSISEYSVDPSDTSSSAIVFPPYKAVVDNVRIVGGENAKDGQASFHCSLLYDGLYDCGCAILSSKFVVTTANCVVGNSPSEIRVLVGTNSLKGNGDYYSVARTIIHEKYNMPERAYDIAVVEVKGPISFNDRVQPIKLSIKEASDGSLAQLTGWGQLAVSSTPDQLQVINLPVVSTVACKKLNPYVHDSHICTLVEEGRGASYVCQCKSTGEKSPRRVAPGGVPFASDGNKFDSVF